MHRAVRERAARSGGSWEPYCVPRSRRPVSVRRPRIRLPAGAVRRSSAFRRVAVGHRTHQMLGTMSNSHFSTEPSTTVHPSPPEQGGAGAQGQAAPTSGEGAGSGEHRIVTSSAKVVGRGTERVERQFERGAAVIWRALRRRPLLGVALAGGAGLFAAEFVGVAELALAGAAGYFAYQVLKKGQPPAEAIREAMRVEREL